MLSCCFSFSPRIQPAGACTKAALDPKASPRLSSCRWGHSSDFAAVLQIRFLDQGGYELRGRLIVPFKETCKARARLLPPPKMPSNQLKTTARTELVMTMNRATLNEIRKGRGKLKPPDNQPTHIFFGRLARPFLPPYRYRQV